MRVIEKCMLRHMKEHSKSKHRKGIGETSIEDKKKKNHRMDQNVEIVSGFNKKNGRKEGEM